MSPQARSRRRGRLAGRGILLVGFRPEAFRAAKKLGLRVALLAEGPRKKEPSYPWALIGPSEAETREAILRLADQTPFEAVMAVTENGVGPACLARGLLDLPGSREPAPLIHKAAMKARIRSAGIPCADWMLLDRESRPEEVADTLGLPLIIKRPTGGGGKNLVVARDLPTLAEAIEPGWVAESYVRGLELSVETIRVDGEARFRNFTRYVEPRWVNLVPSTLSPRVRRSIGALADRALDALELHSGISHLEVFLAEGGPVFGEVAARPPGGRIMDLIELAYGFDPWEALLRIELGGRPRLPKRASRFAAVCFLHPGAGRIRAIHGLEEARSGSGIVLASSRVVPGGTLSPRIGVSERAAEVLATSDTAETCLHHLGNARRAIRFEVEPLDSSP